MRGWAHRKWIAVGFIWAIAVAIPARAAAPVEHGGTPELGPENRVVIGAVGDLLFHGAVHESAQAAGEGQAGYEALFAPVADLLSAPDLTFANLESPVAPLKGGRVRPAAFLFNTTSPALRALGASGIDLFSVANNHIFDQGRRGFLSTLANLDWEQMPYVGAGPVPSPMGPKVVTIRGIRIAFLAWTQELNADFNECARAEKGRPCLQVAVLRAHKPAIAAVKAAAAKADVVIVSLHWGREYELAPRKDQILLAHRLAEAGADVILGHHTHVLQPVERYLRGDGRESVIAYSLGNFISNQSRYFVQGRTAEVEGATRDGALLRIELTREVGNPVRIVSVDAEPLWTDNDWADRERRKEGRAQTIRVVSIPRELERVRQQLAAASEDGATKALKKREKLLERRWKWVREALGPHVVRELPVSAAATALAGAAK